MKVGTFFGIPLFLHWSVWVLLGIVFAIGYPQEVEVLDVQTNKGTFSVMFLTMCYMFVILHEYGHSLMAQRLGLSVKEIVIFCLGGVAKIKFSFTDNPKEEFLVTIAGPAVNLFFIILVFPIAAVYSVYYTDYLTLLLLCVFIANLILFLFNIIPILPMDGGRIARSTVVYLTKDYVGSTLFVTRFGQILASILIIPALLYGFYMMALIFALMIYLGQLEIQNSKVLASVQSVRNELSIILSKPDIVNYDLAKLIRELEEIEDVEIREKVHAEELLKIFRNLVDERDLQRADSGV